jgi:hypothetical protein
MRKEQLVKALLAVAKEKNRKPPQAVAPSRRASTKPQSKLALPGQKAAPAPIKTQSSRAQKHLNAVKAKLNRNKNISTVAVVKTKPRPVKDRIVVMVRDPYWLHVFWELTSGSVDRVRVALNANWHLARPVLRLMEVTDGGTTSASERLIKTIDIHGGVSNWYLHVENPPKSYRVEIGYLAGDKFAGLARSNIVTTPQPGSSDTLDEHWADVAQNFDKIYAMSGGYTNDGSSTELQELFEERLRRPMGSPMTTRYGHGADAFFPPSEDFVFDIDAEMIVFGRCDANAHVTVRGEPVKLRPDGTFTLRMSMPNQRQVIPAVASSLDGSEQRTIVLAVERNTKVMEPISREADE